jgi:hypothetical protein
MKQQQHPWGVGDTTPLRSSAAVVALWNRWGDIGALSAVLRQVRTWGELLDLSTPDRARLIGPGLVTVDLPALCPPLPPMPAGAGILTPYETAYPPALPATRWPVLYVAGVIPDRAMISIGGGNDPSPQGVEIARSAALAAAGQNIPVVICPIGGVGLTALRTTIDAGAVAVAVVPHALEDLTAHQGLLDSVRRLGGAVVTITGPGTVPGPGADMDVAQIMVALTRATVLAEVGSHPSAGAAIARAAVEAGQYLIVPAPHPHHTPAGALGLEVLTRPRMFTASWFGTSPRIQSRAAAGLSAADAVVTDQAQIATALRARCT